MSDERYAEKMKEVIASNPELALELHMELKNERDKERWSNEKRKHIRMLIDKNILTAIGMADNCIDVQEVIDMYFHMMADLKNTLPEKYKEYQEYEKAMKQ